MAVNYKKEFKDVPSALTFLTSDGITGAHILNGKIKAPNSKFDGLDANEKNLLKAADYTGYDIPKTNIKDYIKLPGTDLERRGPRGTFRDFYPGDNMNPNNVIPKEVPTYPSDSTIPGTRPVIRPGIDPVYPNRMPDTMVQNRNRPNNTLVKLATMQKLGLLG